MAGFGEPFDWTQRRQQDAVDYFPTLEYVEPDDNMEVDMSMLQSGEVPSAFSQSAMSLASFGAQTRAPQQQQGNFLSNAISGLFNVISEIDKPLSQRLGFKAEGQGALSSIENIAMEEATRPSNILLAAGGLLTGGLSTGAAGARIAAGAAARAAARNIVTGVGARVAAEGAGEALDYLGVENPMARQAAQLGAGFAGGGITGLGMSGLNAWRNAARAGMLSADDSIRAAAEASLAAEQAARAAAQARAVPSRWGYLMGGGEEFGPEDILGGINRSELPDFANLPNVPRSTATRTFPQTATGATAAPGIGGIGGAGVPPIPGAVATGGAGAAGGAGGGLPPVPPTPPGAVPPGAGGGAQAIPPQPLTWGTMNWRERISGILGIPMHLRSSMDISAPRQVGTTMAAHPGIAKNVLTAEASALFSEKNFTDQLDSILNSANAPQYQKMGLEFSDLVTKREEQISSALLNAIPGVNKLIRPSDRSFAAAVNEARRGLADNFLDKIAKMDPAEAARILNDDKEMQRIGKFIMAATGRGSIPSWLAENAVLGQPIFWAPRLLASRIQIPATIFFTGGPAGSLVRGEALRQTAAFAAANAGLLFGASKLGADIETDPRSSDFGKIRVGDRRFDTLGGYGQITSLLTRLGYSTYNSITGEEEPTFKGISGAAGEGDYYNRDALQIVGNFLRSKMAPIPSEVMNQLYGTDFTGARLSSDAKIRVRDAAINLLSPLALEQLAQESFTQLPETTRREGGAAAFKQFGQILGNNLVYMNGIGGGYYLPRPADLAAQGKYNEMNAENQLDAIRSASWFAIRDSIGASNYRSYRAWQDNLSKEYTKMFEDAGLDKALAQQQATSMINKMAATKNYQNISRMYENQWIMDHPEDAKRILNSELNKPFNQRRLSLTQEQLRLLQSVG